MLLRSLHIASRQLFYLLVICIILGLLGLIGAVWLSDEVAERKDEIAAWASDKTGYPITIESAGLYWFDLIPKLEVRQVTLLQKTGSAPVATAEQLYLSLDIFSSIEQREPVVADASISGVALSVERNLEGQVRLMGLKSDKRHLSGTTLPEVIRWFSWLKQLELSNIAIAYDDRQKSSISGDYILSQANFSFADNSWLTTATIQLPEHIGDEVSFSGQAQIHSDYTLKSWQGKLDAGSIILEPLLAEQDLNGVLIESGKASFVVEAVKAETGHFGADINLALSDVSVSGRKADGKSESFEVNRMQGRLKWQSQAETWQIYSEGLQVQAGGELWPLTRFDIKKSEKGEIQAESNYLRLSDFTAVALLMDGMPEPLITTKPAGDISNLSLSYHAHTGLESIQFNAKDMAMLPWQEYPGVNGLTFDLEWTPQQAELKMDSHNVTIYADTWLEDAVFLDSLTGNLSGQFIDDGWHVVADSLSLWNEDLNLQLDGRISHHNELTDTDLTLTMQDVVINRWKAYVPQSIMPDDFKTWANDAFKQGVIKTGHITLQGNPAEFPFESSPAQGDFDMQLQVENAQLHYAPGWPDIVNVNGQISGQGNNLTIKSQSGNIAGFAFNDVTTTISNLVLSNPILRVDGLLNGTTKQAISFLQNSPLQNRFGSIAESFQVEGNSDIQLQLMVPLIDPDATQASGHVTFENSKIRLNAMPDFHITEINGLLNFNNDGVTSEQIKAVILGEPAVASVEPENGQTLVKVKGNTSTTQINAIWPGSVPNFISGHADYLTKIQVREPEEGMFDVGVVIESTLEGITIETPEPLAKTAEQAKQASLSINQNSLGELVYRVSFDNWFNTTLIQNDTGVSGQLMLGGDKSETVADGFDVAGSLPELDLDKWLAWQSNRPEKEKQKKLDINSLSIRLDSLLVAQQTIKDVHLEAHQTTSDWQVALSSPQIKGQIGIPHDLSGNQPLAINLAHLKLKLPENNSEKDVSMSSRALWPSMRVAIDELEVDGMRFGKLSLRAQRSSSNWTLESASLSSPVMNASATGQWSKTDSLDRSEFDLMLSSDDLKALLAHFDYQQAIEARQLQLTGNLNWTGDPLSFSRQALNGELDLTVGRGSLIDVEPGAAGRFFGLLSIAAIPRRLSLDFSDLFGKGFDFSSINGTFSFANGIARTDDLTMQGDSAEIEVMGPIDMVNKTYNQIVKVTPKVSSTLPIAGAVAGGPVGLGVGTAILIFDKLAGTLFDREIVNLISYSYQLTGPWDSPKLNILNPDAN